MEIPSNSFYEPPLESDVTAAREALEHLRKRATLDSYSIRIFDTSKPEDVKEYTTIMKELLDGIPAKTHFIWARERTLVDGIWKIYLEWSVYKISKDVSETTKPSDKANMAEDIDGQAF